ncbi:MAG: hypothetical protein OXN18_03180 [Gemmatimonadota bacterium]|nr:hypothetical protein [Gemmatimonadota bacterium]
MWHPTPDAIGSPLHIVEDREIKRSFGGFVDPENPRAQTASWRAFTTDSAQRIFSAPLYGAYSIEVWAGDGRRVTGFLVPGFNDPPRDPDAPESADNPPASTIRALRVVSEDRLWVLTWRRRDDWLDMMEERPGPGGRTP